VPLGRLLNFCIEEQLMMIYKLSGRIVSAQPRLKLVELSYPEPPHAEQYAKYFKAPIRFRAPETRITISTHPLDHPLPGNDKEFHEICRRQCALMMHRIHAGDSMASRIKCTFTRLRQAHLSMEAVAAELTMSTRSLRRHLKEEGVTYQQLVDQYRIERAQEYLRDASISTKQVSYLLGFTHPSAFSRAFKRWTGRSIESFRGLQGKLARDGRESIPVHRQATSYQ
jgi:AraC-like DNA-binding protein